MSHSPKEKKIRLALKSVNNGGTVPSFQIIKVGFCQEQDETESGGKRGEGEKKRRKEKKSDREIERDRDK